MILRLKLKTDFTESEVSVVNQTMEKKMLYSHFLSKNQPGRHGSPEDMPGVYPQASASLSFILEGRNVREITENNMGFIRGTKSIKMSL